MLRPTFPWSVHQSYQTVWGQNGGQKRFFNALFELMVTRKEIQRRPLIRWSLIYKNYNMNTFEEMKLILFPRGIYVQESWFGNPEAFAKIRNSSCLVLWESAGTRRAEQAGWWVALMQAGLDWSGLKWRREWKSLVPQPPALWGRTGAPWVRCIRACCPPKWRSHRSGSKLSAPLHFSQPPDSQGGPAGGNERNRKV